MYKEKVCVAVFFSILLLSSFVVAADNDEPQVKLSLWQKIINFFSRETPQNSPDPFPAEPNKIDPKEPIKVCTPQDLDNVRKNLAGNYIQICDINLTGYKFKTMGDWDSPFKGTYNGNKHKISYLTILEPGMEGVGLFAYLGVAGYNTTIKNVYLENINISGSSDVGGISGAYQAGNVRIDNVVINGQITGKEEIGGVMGGDTGVIEKGSFFISNSKVNVSINSKDPQCSAIGGVMGRNFLPGQFKFYNITGTVSINAEQCENVGGLLGESWEATIENSFIQGSVKARSISGGLIGYSPHFSRIIASNYQGEVIAYNNISGGLVGATSHNLILSSYSAGKVICHDCNVAGGLVGLTGVGDLILNSYSTSEVSGGSKVGGLIGVNEYDPIGPESHGNKIAKTYSTGKVTGKWFVGGLIGDGIPNDVSLSYWDKETSGKNKSDGGIGKTTTEMKKQNTYQNWDFVNEWKMEEGISYPVLQKRNVDPYLLRYYNFDSVYSYVKFLDASHFSQELYISGVKLIPGKKNNSMFFGGSSLGVSPYTHSLAEIATVAPFEFTITTWIKLNKTTQETGQDAQVILTNTLVGKNWGPYSLKINSEDKVEFNFYSDNKNNNKFSVISETSLQKNEWTFITIKPITIKKFNEPPMTGIRLYLNGKLDKEVLFNEGVNIYLTENDLTIGAAKKIDGTYQNFLNGALDEMQIYSRALSDQEIQSLYK